MLKAGEGAVVKVSSQASFRASASGVAYTSSKHAVNGFTKSVAPFYKAEGIRHDAVAPRAVLTNNDAPFESEHGKVIGPIFEALLPTRTTADRLAANITYLVSDDASTSKA